MQMPRMKKEKPARNVCLASNVGITSVVRLWFQCIQFQFYYRKKWCIILLIFLTISAHTRKNHRHVCLLDGLSFC